jgi:hypothetical protein
VGGTEGTKGEAMDVSAKKDLDKRPGWMTEDELKEQGWHRDDVGRVRTSSGGYICGVSGRERTHHLYVVFDVDRETGGVRRLWVDSDTLRSWGLELVAGLGREGVREIRRWSQGVAMRLAEGWLTRKVLGFIF